MLVESAKVTVWWNCDWWVILLLVILLEVFQHVLVNVNNATLHVEIISMRIIHRLKTFKLGLGLCTVSAFFTFVVIYWFFGGCFYSLLLNRWFGSSRKVRSFWLPLFILITVTIVSSLHIASFVTLFLLELLALLLLNLYFFFFFTAFLFS